MVDNNCRICAESFDEELGPLFAPCECRGSMEFVHVKCLQIWVEMRYKNRVNSPLKCEVCNAYYQVDVLVEYKVNCSENCSFRNFFYMITYLILLAGICIGLLFPLGPFALVVFCIGVVFIFSGSCYAWICVPTVVLHPRVLVVEVNVVEIDNPILNFREPGESNDELSHIVICNGIETADAIECVDNSNNNKIIISSNLASNVGSPKSFSVASISEDSKIIEYHSEVKINNEA